MKLMVALLMMVSVVVMDDLGANEPCCDVNVTVKVAEDIGTVYMSGNHQALGPWRPDRFALQGEGAVRTGTFRVPRGFELEYKFTLGTWAQEAAGPSGMVMPNFKTVVSDNLDVEHVIEQFRADPLLYMEDWQGSGVRGSLVYWRELPSAHLDLSRHVVIWLPPDYDAAREPGYPVLYMTDGQNLFDPRMAGSAGVIWDVDDAVLDLAAAGTIPQLIVVGVFNTAERTHEYSPWHQAPEYARFLLEELMPRVNEAFNTLQGPENTALIGSSMGGLLSYYLLTEHPDVFGACGCVSSHFVLQEEWVARLSGRPAEPGGDTPYIIRDIENGLVFPRGVRYWFDYGTEGLDAEYGPPHDALRQAFLAQGWTEGEEFVIREYPGADHSEADWRDRLPDVLTFVFGR